MPSRSSKFITLIILLTLTPFVVAAAPNPAPTVVEGVDDTQEGPLLLRVVGDRDGACEAFSRVLNAPCLVSPSVEDADPRLDEARHSGLIRYFVEVDRREDDRLTLRVTDWDRNSPGHPVMERRVRLSDGDDLGAMTTEQILRENTLGSTMLEEDYSGRAYFRLRPILWYSKSMAWATWWYHASKDLNSRDWDFEGLHSDDPGLRSQADKWLRLEGFRFDDNVMHFNTPMHPLAGAGYHIIARSNHMGIWMSILATNLTSIFWEAVIEHHEVMSLNDLIFTGIAGIPMGEAYMQLGQFFRRATPTPLNRALAWVFAAPMEFHDLIDGTGPLHFGERGDLGWPEESWHHFNLYSTVSASEQEGAGDRLDLGVGLDTELVRLPRWRRPGSEDRFVTGPVSTELDASFTAGSQGMLGWHVHGSMDFLGWYRQEMEDDLSTGLRGYSAFAGLGMAFRHHQHEYGDYNDRYGVLNLPGLSLHGAVARGPLQARARYRLTPDLTTNDSRAVDTFEAQTGRTPNRTVLADWGYYFGYGYSHGVRLDATLDRFRVFYNLDYHWIRAIDGLDRYDAEDLLIVDDRILTHRGGASAALPWEPLRLGVEAEVRDRSGAVTDQAGGVFSAESSQWRVMGVIQALF